MNYKKTANSVALVSGGNLVQGYSVSQGKDRHFFAKIKAFCAMNNIVFTLLGFLLVGTAQEKKYIITKVQPDYFEEPVFSDIFLAAKRLLECGQTVDFLSVGEALFSEEGTAIEQRLKNFKRYFQGTGDILAKGAEKEVKSLTRDLLINMGKSYSYAVKVESVTGCFLAEFVKNAKSSCLTKYLEIAKRTPGEDFSEALRTQLLQYDAILKGCDWHKYVIDLPALAQMPEDVALISRKGVDYFFRGNLYLISGMAGSMKSYLCLCIAAAAINRGVDAGKTLSFCAIAEPLKILYAETELANNSIRKRWEALQKMVGARFSADSFTYLSLRKVPGTIADKRRVFDEACRQIEPDVIILDSGRDLCLDFNDNREADELVNYFHQLATDLNAVLISTCHQSLAAGNAKGHFGMRFNEKSALEISLARKASVNGMKYVEVNFNKERDDAYKSFRIRFNADTGLLEEDDDPTVDHTDETRQKRSAREAVLRALQPGEKLSHSSLVRRLMNPAVPGIAPVSNGTAKNYIHIMFGEVLTKDKDGKYSLVQDYPALGFSAAEDSQAESLEDMPAEICSAPS